MSILEIHQFICRSDNYGVLVHDHRSGATMAIDAPDATAIMTELGKRGWQLTHILTTHHHIDHVEGNLELKKHFSCKIIGPAAEADRIPGIDQLVKGGDEFKIAKRSFKVYDCPGHTQGHIAFHEAEDYSLFAGDTLFAMGCGRVLEGTLQEMYQAVNQFKTFEPFTSVHCGHEYTLANAKFALSVEPNNRKLQQRTEIVERLRAQGKMTCPTTIGEELDTNPFLRCDSLEIRANLNMAAASDAEVFAELRTRKNSF
jgi:hydroxyacylglutathione hydrolase